MSKTTEQLTTIAEALPADAQQALLDIAKSLASPKGAYGALSVSERAELQKSIAEADAGDLCTQAELDRELDALLARPA